MACMCVVLSDLLQVLRVITRRSARRIAQSSCAPSQSQIEFRASLTLLQVHVPPPPWKPLAAMTSSRRMLAADDDDDFSWDQPRSGSSFFQGIKNSLQRWP